MNNFMNWFTSATSVFNLDSKKFQSRQILKQMLAQAQKWKLDGLSQI